MSMFNKLKFWKKNDADLGLPQDDISAEASASGFNDELGLESSKSNMMERTGEFTTLDKIGLEEQHHQNLSNQNSFQQAESGKDFELISSKLDTIKAELDSMNQRIKKIEKIAEGEQSKSKDKLW